MEKTVKDVLEECTADINRIKVLGGANLVVIKILENLITAVTVIAKHTAAAKLE